MVVFAGNGGGGEEGMVVAVFFGGIFEIRFGGEMHLAEFFFSDGFDTITVNWVLAVFDFGEVNMIAFGGYEVDFIEVGFVVLSDDGVSLAF